MGPKKAVAPQVENRTDAHASLKISKNQETSTVIETRNCMRGFFRKMKGKFEIQNFEAMI